MSAIKLPEKPSNPPFYYVGLSCTIRGIPLHCTVTMLGENVTDELLRAVRELSLDILMIGDSKFHILERTTFATKANRELPVIRIRLGSKLYGKLVDFHRKYGVPGPGDSLKRERPNFHVSLPKELKDEIFKDSEEFNFEHLYCKPVGNGDKLLNLTVSLPSLSSNLPI